VGLKAGLRRGRRRDFRAWRVHSLAVGALVLLVVMSPHHAVLEPGAGATPGPVPSATSSADLQNEKLRQQIRQLELSNDDASSPWRYVIALAPTLAGLAAVLTFGLGWATQRSESRRQKEHDRIQRESESIREFDARFAGVVSDLGSDSISRQASAAATLPLFLAPRYTDFRSHIIRVASANLRLSRDEIVLNLLVDVLGAAIRAQYAVADQANPGETVNLTDTYLRGLNVTGASMREKLVADRADLSNGRLDEGDFWKAELRRATLTRASFRHANLGQAQLDGANVSHAVFHACRTTSARLCGIDGRYARFQGAYLQSAHFEDADLRGARFDGADLADCYFLGAELDTGALESVLKSRRWRTAHFDPEVRERLLANSSKQT
jgi:Pentapeptide repeats (9 copies)